MPLLLFEQINDDNALINKMLENMAVLNIFDSLGERLAECLVTASPASVTIAFRAFATTLFCFSSFSASLASACFSSSTV